MAFEQQKETCPDPAEWFRSTNDPKPGVVSGITFQQKPVQYSAIDGFAIFEGDIVLGTVEEMEQAVKNAQNGERGVVVSGNQFRWPGGVVPYEIAPNLPSAQIVNAALRHWEDNTGIRFILRTSANANAFPNYVSFQDQGVCQSQVGMRTGRQEISLALACGFGAAVHEIGHAVGLWHEQSREDRDQFIQVLWQNIEPNQVHNFNQHIVDGDDVGGYDFGSIMHYGPQAFGKRDSNGQVMTTIVAKGGQAIGQRNGLSVNDINAVRAIYPQLKHIRRYDGIWNPGDANQVVEYGLTSDAFRERYGQLWGQNYRLIAMQTYDSGNGQRRYNGIWSPSTANQGVVWGWTPDDFRKRYGEMWTAGYRLIAMQAYDIGGGQFRYDGVWNPSTANQGVVWGWTLDDFRKRYGEMWTAGYRLIAMQAYDIGGGQLRYDGIWNPSTANQGVVWGWTRDDFIKHYNEMWTAGYRLIAMQAYDIGGGQFRYDGVWNPSTANQGVVWGWTPQDFRQHDAELRKAGFQLSAMQTYGF